MTSERFLTAAFASSADKLRGTPLPLWDMPIAPAVGHRKAFVTARAAGKSGDMPTASVRHALRALAGETGPDVVRRAVKLVRLLVAQAQEVLRERLEAGSSVEDYLHGRARLADSAVIGLLHIASVSTRVRGDTMVAPLAVVAVGGYGRSELAPGSDLDLLFLLPESIHPNAAAATAACLNAVVTGCRSCKSLLGTRRGALEGCRWFGHGEHLSRRAPQRRDAG